MTDPAPAFLPACSMHEADDAYMGYADRTELVGFLLSLLAAAPAVQWSKMLRRELARWGAPSAPGDRIAAAEGGPVAAVCALRAMLLRVRAGRDAAGLRG